MVNRKSTAKPATKAPTPEAEWKPSPRLKVALDNLAGAMVTSDRRLAHWWNILRPMLGLTGKPDEIREKEIERFLSAELGYTSDQVGCMTVAAVNNILRREVERRRTTECYVTLQQMAAMLNRTKRHLERIKAKLPTPDARGGKGKPDEWKWSKVRPILCELFNRQLEPVFPADRFVRR